MVLTFGALVSCPMSLLEKFAIYSLASIERAAAKLEKRGP